MTDQIAMNAFDKGVVHPTKQAHKSSGSDQSGFGAVFAQEKNTQTRTDKSEQEPRASTQTSRRSENEASKRTATEATQDSQRVSEDRRQYIDSQREAQQTGKSNSKADKLAAESDATQKQLSMARQMMKLQDVAQLFAEKDTDEESLDLFTQLMAYMDSSLQDSLVDEQGLQWQDQQLDGKDVVALNELVKKIMQDTSSHEGQWPALNPDQIQSLDAYFQQLQSALEGEELSPEQMTLFADKGLLHAVLQRNMNANKDGLDPGALLENLDEQWQELMAEGLDVDAENPQEHMSDEKRALQMLEKLFHGNLNKVASDRQAFDQAFARLNELSERLSTDGVNKAGDLLAGQAAQNSQRPQAIAQPLSLNLPVNHQQWSNAFGQRISFMVNNQLQQADIHLNPPELGPISVRLQINNDQATVSFNATHAVVRDAIESAIPRLREMLQDSGISLGNVDVSTQLAQKERGQDQQGDSSSASNGQGQSAEEDGSELAGTAQTVQSDRLVDTFV